MAIWVLKDGRREGPYEEQDVRELLYEGTYIEADAAIRDGQFDWTTLGQLLGRNPPRTEASPPEPLPLEPIPPIPEPPPLKITPEPVPIATIPEPEPPSIPAALPPELPSPAAPGPTPVTVIDFQMPFGSMVVFMVKWAVAAIPALLILCTIAAIFWTVFLSVIALVLRH